MEFIRETIAHRSTSSNIGSDEIHAQCIDIKEEAVDLEEDFSNVKEIVKQRIRKSFHRI